MGRRHQGVWVVVTAYNEGGVIGDVLLDLLGHGYEVVVVDDHSQDTTYQTALSAPVHVCRHPVNLGQGAALQTGIDYCLQHGARVIVTFDGDGQHQAKCIDRLVQPLLRGEADVALGTRFGAGGAAINIPRKKRLTLRLAVLFTRLTTRLEVTDTHNGLRAFTAQAASAIRITQNRMAHASQILSQIAERKLRYCEVPVEVVYSRYSVAKGQKIGNALNILWEDFTELLWKSN